MQPEEKTLAITIGKLLKEIRDNTGKSLNLFCNEYDLATTTVNEIENGNKSPQLFTVLRIVRAYGLTLPEFFEMVEKELPKDFLTPEV